MTPRDWLADYLEFVNAPHFKSESDFHLGRSGALELFERIIEGERSPEELSKLIAAAEELGDRPEAQYDYAPLIHLLALTGLRVGEALALRWEDVDLLGSVLHVRHSWSRDGVLTDPKTEAGVRDVPLSPGLVDLLVRLKREDASGEDFVFASRPAGRPVSYWNFRRRGFEKALKVAGLSGRGSRSTISEAPPRLCTPRRD